MPPGEYKGWGTIVGKSFATRTGEQTSTVRERKLDWVSLGDGKKACHRSPAVPARRQHGCRVMYVRAFTTTYRAVSSDNLI